MTYHFINPAEALLVFVSGRGGGGGGGSLPSDYLLPQLKQNIGGHKIKTGHVCGTAADNTKHGPASTWIRKSLPTIRYVPHFWRRLLGNVVGEQFP